MSDSTISAARAADRAGFRNTIGRPTALTAALALAVALPAGAPHAVPTDLVEAAPTSWSTPSPVDGAAPEPVSTSDSTRSAASSSDSSRERPGTSAVHLSGLTPGQRAIVTEVIGRFEDAGLALPSMAVRGGTATDCNGRDGVHRRRVDRSEIVLCSEPSDGWDRRVVGHEMAHAWVAHNVTDDQRADFLALRGSTHWHDEAVAWRDNGTEQAAEIVSWAVHDDPTPLLVDVTSCAELERAFEILTETTSPHGHTRFCDLSQRSATRS